MHNRQSTIVKLFDSVKFYMLTEGYLSFLVNSDDVAIFFSCTGIAARSWIQMMILLNKIVYSNVGILYRPESK